ncbi:MAG: DUF6094 domain-containing protein [Chloroflexota bacterium]
MTRLANIEKAGYFPLPPSVTDLIVSHVTAPHGGRLLDPCAGEGTALVTLAQGWGLEPFGVELHADRAETARQRVAEFRMQHAAWEKNSPAELRTPQALLHDSYLNLKSARGGYNLLYLNPPYLRDDGGQDAAETNGSTEYQFLWRTRPYLQADGLLVYVVPQHPAQPQTGAVPECALSGCPGVSLPGWGV